jgi:hypothetical protein
VVERLLGGRLGDALEAWERRRKLARFGAAANRPTSAAELDAERVKGHFDDHGQPILRRFEERVRQFEVAIDREPVERIDQPTGSYGLPALAEAGEAPPAHTRGA